MHDGNSSIASVSIGKRMNNELDNDTLRIDHRLLRGFTINGAVDYSIVPRDTTLERYFPYKPTLSEIKEAISDLNGDINWIALDKREVEIKKTTLLGITNPKNI